MNLIRTPDVISSNELVDNNYSFSSSLYKKVILSSAGTVPLRDLLCQNAPYDKGEEPGSVWYMTVSPCKFIRTKAFQDFSSILYPKGNAIVGINPKVFVNQHLEIGDILMSKDSNIGECAVVTEGQVKNHMYSGGIVRLNIESCDHYYLFSFLKHPFFRQQLECKVPRGATIKHAKELWLDCKIPLPNNKSILNRVSALMQAIIAIEIEIQNKSDDIQRIIDNELANNQSNSVFQYSYPCINEIEQIGRLDAAIYSIAYKQTIWEIENYTGGYLTPKEDGFVVIPGPSLEIKLLKVRIDSEIYRDGYYSLILPTNISEYGTMNAIPYLGTPKQLPALHYGDVVFGEAGFQKGRSIVLLDNNDDRWYTTNAHGLYARRKDNDIDEAIFFRCIFDWYRRRGLIDLMAVGGSGGHFSPEYFENIRIPKFPKTVKENIVSKYHMDCALKIEYNGDKDYFISSWKQKAKQLGIWELSNERMRLLSEMNHIQKEIIDGSC